MSKKAESILTTKIAKAIKQAWPFAYVRKLSDRFQRGLPDLIVCLPWNGRHYFIAIEVKTPTGTVEEIQKVEGDEIKKSGGHWIVGRSVNEVLDFMEELTS